MRSLVISPHPDDEVLGTGGTLLKRKAEGHSTAWIIVTEMSRENGYDNKSIQKRNIEIKEIADLFGFNEVYKLGLPATKLDTLDLGDIINKISECLKLFQPEELFIPHRSDSHSDHRVVFEAAASCTKWFRYPFIRKILSYETISETNVSLDIGNTFKPNVYIDISNFLEQKIEAMKIYESEIGVFPFPRSEEAITALARFRGSSSGFFASEAFELLLERY
jgi:LmbE family N-acetylglucosaminyl deacetylase